MSCLSLGNKLPPPKRAWESFTSKLQRKLHKLKQSKAIIKKTTSRLNTTLAAVLNRSPSFPSRLLQRETKRRVIARSSASTLRRPHKQYHKHHSRKQKFAPVYVDDLFTTEPISVQASTTVTTTGKVIEKSPVESSSDITYVPPKDCSGQAVMEVPQLQGVDKRAEEFIAKFKEEMRLQRQRSFGEYQEMLARGS
ncbi:uncharacterized protein LOC122641908 isoform X2 [Telopea speciosissima]|uniref:uncharacterized protein LOC122641908 isoform X1 n=1 Tax=Telopea speciosissima TaxID=54955 RepID=UPI001CC4176C|nr:uncharacterized protein LOC122641908 isoform X1 [Telopea speciosissima]XP_043691171.1 uncharacterized protein LOC122641908 isoform X2 [Telopea speciosissima]